MKQSVGAPLMMALCLSALLCQGCLTTTVRNERTALHGMIDTVLKDWLKRSPNLTRAEPRILPGEVVVMLSKNLPAAYTPEETEPKVIVLSQIVRHTPQENTTIRIDRNRYAVSYHVISMVSIKSGFRRTRITVGDNLHRSGAGAQATYVFRKKDGSWALDETGPVMLK